MSDLVRVPIHETNVRTRVERHGIRFFCQRCGADEFMIVEWDGRTGYALICDNCAIEVSVAGLDMAEDVDVPPTRRFDL